MSNFGVGASSPRRIYVNGKFTRQRITGVQRVASQTLLALDRLLLSGPPSSVEWLLLHPAGAAVPALGRIQVRAVGPAGLPLHLWEQIVLPWAARGGRLLNLSGSSPWAPRGQICMLHDAAVFDQPQAYAPAFVRWYSALFRHQARSAQTLLTVSQTSRERLALHLRVPADRIVVVPNGGDHLDGVVPDAAVLDRHGLRGRRYLLAVASANATKNLARLVEAHARLRQRHADVLLVLVGGGNAAVFAQGSATAAPGVVRTGPLSDAPLKCLYENALALAFPSLYEGFGLPPLEAMSCGCPVAAARAASIPEVCGDAALYFDPLSIEDMSRALCRLVAEEPLRLRLVAAGRARVGQWRWDATARALSRAIGNPA